MLARQGISRRVRPHHLRRGVAAVEMAAITPLLLILILGIWEVSRMVEVQQVLQNAAREGARQAASGRISASAVKTVVSNYLTSNKIDGTKATITVTNVTTAGVDPTNATQLDQFRVDVSIPFDEVGWLLVLRVTNVATLSTSATWFSQRDVPLAVSSNIPY